MVEEEAADVMGGGGGGIEGGRGCTGGGKVGAGAASRLCTFMTCCGAANGGSGGALCEGGTPLVNGCEGGTYGRDNASRDGEKEDEAPGGAVNTFTLAMPPGAEPAAALGA